MPPKKSFSSNLSQAFNPALQFISPESIQKADTQEPVKKEENDLEEQGEKAKGVGPKSTVAKPKRQAKARTSAPASVENTAEEGPKKEPVCAAKLHKQEQVSVDTKEQTSPATTQTREQRKKKEPLKKQGPRREERKTKRVQLLFQPSLYAKIQEEAARKNTSVNEYIHSVLEEMMG